MAGKKVVWSFKAKAELKLVLEFYSQRNGSPSYSLNLLGKVEELCHLLSDFELMGRLASDKSSRVIPLGHYLIFYHVKPKQIEILSFWDNRQEMIED